MNTTYFNVANGSGNAVSFITSLKTPRAQRSAIETEEYDVMSNVRNGTLLIAALATVCLWWVGLIAEQANWHRQFQANTVRDRRVLSVPYLGREVVRRCDYIITLCNLIAAHQLLLHHISAAHEL